MARKKPQITENINNHDARIIEALWMDVSQNFDTEMARKLVMEPDSIIHLISNDKTGLVHHELKCFYAVHAICLALVGDECADILNQMPDHNINVLKQCLAVAKKHKRPDTDKINKILAERSVGKHVASPEDYWINESMIKSLNVAISIDGLWEDAVKELRKWSDAIDGFERKEIQPVVKEVKGEATTDKSELWTIEELASKLGCQTKHAFEVKKCTIIKAHPDRAAEIKGWFVRDGRRIFFKPEYFDELQKLYAEKPERKNAKKSSKKKPVVNKMSDKSAKKSKKQNNVKVSQETAKTCADKMEVVEEKTDAPMTLVDLKGFETYIKVLTESYKNTSVELNKAEEICANAMAEATNAKAAERGKLLERAIKANESVAGYQSALDDFKSCLDAAKKLLQDRNRAMAEVNAANAKIAQILQEFEQSKQH